MSMKDNLADEVSGLPDDDQYDKIVETVEDQKYGRLRYVVKRVAKQKDGEEVDEDGTGSLQETIFFQRRTEDLGLDKCVGQRVNTMKDSQKSEHGGYYCGPCDTHVWDSNAWLDHLNGKKHARLIGMNNKVEKVGIDDIKAKLQSYKDAKLQRNRVFEQLREDTDSLSQRKRNEEKLLQIAKEKEEAEQPTKKVFKKNNGEEQVVQPPLNQEEEEEEADEEESSEDEEQAMMAMMGLPTSFQASKNKK